MAERMTREEARAEIHRLAMGGLTDAISELSGRPKPVAKGGRDLSDDERRAWIKGIAAEDLSAAKRTILGDAYPENTEGPELKGVLGSLRHGVGSAIKRVTKFFQ